MKTRFLVFLITVFVGLNAFGAERKNISAFICADSNGNQSVRLAVSYEITDVLGGQIDLGNSNELIKRLKFATGRISKFAPYLGFRALSSYALENRVSYVNADLGEVDIDIDIPSNCISKVIGYSSTPNVPGERPYKVNRRLRDQLNLNDLALLQLMFFFESDFYSSFSKEMDFNQRKFIHAIAMSSSRLFETSQNYIIYLLSLGFSTAEFQRVTSLDLKSFEYFNSGEVKAAKTTRESLFVYGSLWHYYSNILNGETASAQIKGVVEFHAESGKVLRVSLAKESYVEVPYDLISRSGLHYIFPKNSALTYHPNGNFSHGCLDSSFRYIYYSGNPDYYWDKHSKVRAVDCMTYSLEGKLLEKAYAKNLFFKIRGIAIEFLARKPIGFYPIGIKSGTLAKDQFLVIKDGSTVAFKKNTKVMFNKDGFAIQ